MECTIPCYASARYPRVFCALIFGILHQLVRKHLPTLDQESAQICANLIHLTPNSHIKRQELLQEQYIYTLTATYTAAGRKLRK